MAHNAAVVKIWKLKHIEQSFDKICKHNAKESSYVRFVDPRETVCCGPGQSSLDKGSSTLSLRVGHLSTFGIIAISVLSGIPIIPEY